MSCLGVATAEPVSARASIAPHAPERTRRAHASVPAPRLRAVPPVAGPPPDLLATIYDAATAPERWPDVLAGLAAALGGSAATLHAGLAGAPCRIAAAHGLGEDALRRYGSRCAALDPVVAAAMADGTAWAAPVTAREAAGAGLERTAFFTGWMRPNGIDDLLCLALLPPGAGSHAAVAVARPRRVRRFGQAEAAVLSRFAPHLRRAMEVHRRLSAAAKPPLAEALDRLAAGVALSDAGGAVVWANRPARALLGSGDGLSLDRRGVLRASAPGAAEALRWLLRNAAAGVEGAFAVPRPSGRAALALHAVPLPARAGREDFAPGPLPEAAPRPSVMLLLSDPESVAPDAALRRRLRGIYGLTEAEATVASRAARGIGLPEVAQSLGLSVATARCHAQRVFSKAGVRGQAELARHVERLGLLRAEHAE